MAPPDTTDTDDQVDPNQTAIELPEQPAPRTKGTYSW